MAQTPTVPFTRGWTLLFLLAGACSSSGDAPADAGAKVDLFEDCENAFCAKGTCISPQKNPFCMDSSGSCGFICGAECVRDNDCAALGESAPICLEGLCAPSCQRGAAKDYFCDGANYVSCDDRPADEKCTECGCRGNKVCNAETDRCEPNGALKAGGAKCETDHECQSNLCVHKLCNAGTGNPCTAESCSGCNSFTGSCSTCLTDGESSYCANGCTDFAGSGGVTAGCPDNPIYVCTTDTSRCRKPCTSNADCLLKNEECKVVTGTTKSVCVFRENQAAGSPCYYGSECASEVCESSVCTRTDLAMGQACKSSAQCASMRCVAGLCAAGM